MPRTSMCQATATSAPNPHPAGDASLWRWYAATRHPSDQLQPNPVRLFVASREVFVAWRRNYRNNRLLREARYLFSKHKLHSVCVLLWYCSPATERESSLDCYLDRHLTPTGRLNRHILGCPPLSDDQGNNRASSPRRLLLLVWRVYVKRQSDRTSSPI